MTNKEADGTVDEELYQATYWAVQDAASEALCWVLSNSVEPDRGSAAGRVVWLAVLRAVNGSSRMESNEEARRAFRQAVYGSVNVALDEAVSGTVYWALRDSVEAVIWDPVDRTVREAVLTAVVQGARQ